MDREEYKNTVPIPHISDIHAMFFDMDDTLVKYREAVRAGFKSIKNIVPELDNVTVEELEENFRRLFNYEEIFKTGISYADDAKTRIIKVIGDYGSYNKDNIMQFTTAFWQAFWEERRLIDGAGDVLKLCNRMKIPVAIISNGNLQMQFRTMARLKLYRYVDIMLAPRNAEEMKPNNLLFERAMNTLNVAPEDVIMIGNSISSDMKGAINSGIAPVWFNHSGRDKPEDIDITEIVSFYELIKIWEPMD